MFRTPQLETGLPHFLQLLSVFCLFSPVYSFILSDAFSVQFIPAYYHLHSITFWAFLEFPYTYINVCLFCQICEQDPRCNRLKLTDLLIAPMHHWTRVPLILERIRKHTADQNDISRLDESILKFVKSLSKCRD